MVAATISLLQSLLTTSPVTPFQQIVTNENNVNGSPRLKAKNQIRKIPSKQEEIRPQDERIQKRMKVIEELIATEQSYQQSLSVIVEHFVEPIRKKKILSEEEISLVFSNLEVIMELSKTFLDKLEARVNSWKVEDRPYTEHFLSDIFIFVFPFMKIYSIYCSNYEKMISFMDRNKNNNKLNSFIRSCEQRADFKGLDFASLLIMPIQRIPRYRLLLQELVKCTPGDHPDFSKLSGALETIKNIASFINNMNQQSAGTKLITLQKSFGSKIPNLVEPWRVWIKDGPVEVLGITEEGRVAEMIPMHLYLFNDLLVFARSPTVYLNRAPLLLTWVKDEPDTSRYQNLFQVFTPDISFIFCAETDEEKYSWIKQLATNIDRQVQQREQREQREQALHQLLPKGESVEEAIGAFLQFKPRHRCNSSLPLISSTKRIDNKWRTFSRHFTLRRGGEVPFPEFVAAGTVVQEESESRHESSRFMSLQSRSRTPGRRSVLSLWESSPPASHADTPSSELTRH